ncbi:hypothetical protein BCR24_06640 [Enterococcus ureilyticus]|uniref:Uncharacterized protein n=1 Tax=Enterococcus ureilyticus TaxID=1131292 RepID=A0A1E5H9N5_9ENTE|nr:hypothetical protein [Enterococcus ureilyticus]MBM7688446.1 hypothetical protein [Enterococcus ureilyticus]OEG21545.1 hypothetical protein BCR24_06640 [Enterococcus ureilyticus]
MFGKKSVLSRKQVNAVCILFKCEKNDFVVRRFEDGFLVSIRSKEYRVKFSEGFRTKIVYAKEVQRVANKGDR